MFLYLLVAGVIATNFPCKCSDFIEEASCNGYGDCLWANGKCAIQKCQDVKLSQCGFPNCFADGNSCLGFTACENVGFEACYGYSGCKLQSVTTQTCQKKNSQSLVNCPAKTKEQCTTNADCVWIDNLSYNCQTLETCEGITKQINCAQKATKIPGTYCRWTDNKCLTYKVAAFCASFNGASTECSEQTGCTWTEQTKTCSEQICANIPKEECQNQKCAWTGKACKDCWVEGKNYGVIIAIASVALFL